MANRKNRNKGQQQQQGSPGQSSRSNTEPGIAATIGQQASVSAPSSRTPSPGRVKGSRPDNRRFKPRHFPAEFGKSDNDSEFDWQVRITCSEDPSSIQGPCKPVPPQLGPVHTKAIFQLDAPALVPVLGADPATLSRLTLKDVFELADKLNKEYPNAKAQHPETEKKKSDGTRSLRQDGWDKLLGLQEALKCDYGEVPQELLDHFRLDMFGNVVSHLAGPGSPCFFNMDHLFPWSRGGLTTIQNLMPMAQKANLSKSNDLLTFIIKWRREPPGTTTDFVMRTSGPRGKVNLSLVSLKRGLRASDLQRLWDSVKTSAAADGPDKPAPLERLKIVLLLPWISLLQPNNRYWSCPLDDLVQHAGLLKGDLQVMIDRFGSTAVFQDSEDNQEVQEEEQEGSSGGTDAPTEDEDVAADDDPPTVQEQSAQQPSLQLLDSLLTHSKGSNLFDSLQGLLSVLSQQAPASGSSPTLDTVQLALKTLQAFEAQQNDTHAQMRNREQLVHEQQQALAQWSEWYKQMFLPGSPEQAAPSSVVNQAVEQQQHPVAYVVPDPFEHANVVAAVRPTMQGQLASMPVPPPHHTAWLGGRPAGSWASNQVVPWPMPTIPQALPEHHPVSSHLVAVSRQSLWRRLFGCCCGP